MWITIQDAASVVSNRSRATTFRNRTMLMPVIAAAISVMFLTQASADDLMKPFGPDWIVVENQSCQVHNPYPEPGETVTWSGGCVDGKAEGEGRLVWRTSDGSTDLTYEGGMKAGAFYGYGVLTWPSGRYEGEFRGRQAHGYGIAHYESGVEYMGEWRNGCFGDRASVWATLGATPEECGFE